MPAVSADGSQGPGVLKQEGIPQEQTKLRRDALLKMLAGLLESADVASPDLEEEGKLEEERAALGRLAQLSQRDRKAPCKNFFWKTFTSC
ncbi:somatostatin-2-like isoform X4 [Lagopus leucura]|uniref:somatostatin-2-like isoform X4 n=1 Tax=Lagopus leucura TaxID=30410 RepID=UPI001C66282C|nr:somatostatin-2-like isoform X4 [Lagopus leucura]